MNRPIKFRAWDKKLMWVTDDYRIGMDGTLWWHENDSGEWFSGYDKDVILMQFTGLLDKNGKEIYEGDIVHLTKGWHTVESDDREKDTGEDFIEGEVKYFTPYAGFGISGIGFDKLSLFPIEVIGNIYENPELVPTN